MPKRKPSQSRREIAQNKKPQQIRRFGNLRPSFHHKKGKPIKNSKTGAIGSRIKPVSKLMAAKVDVLLSPSNLFTWENYLTADVAFGTNHMQRELLSTKAGNNWTRVHGIPVDEDLSVLYNEYPPSRDDMSCDTYKCNGNYPVKVWPGTCISCPENAYKPGNNSPLFYDAGWACCGCYDKTLDTSEKLGWTYITWLGDGYCDDGAWTAHEYGNMRQAEFDCQGLVYLPNLEDTNSSGQCKWTTGIVNGVCWDVATDDPISQTGINGPLDGNAFPWSVNQHIPTKEDGSCHTGRGIGKVNFACDDWTWDCGDVHFPASAEDLPTTYGGECMGNEYGTTAGDFQGVNDIVDYYSHCNHRLGIEATCKGKCNRNVYRYPPEGDDRCDCEENDPDCQCDKGGLALTAYDQGLGGYGQCFCDNGCTYCNCAVNDVSCYLDCPGNCANPKNNHGFFENMAQLGYPAGNAHGINCGPCSGDADLTSYPDYTSVCPTGSFYEDWADRLGDCCDDYEEFCQAPKTDLPCECYRRGDAVTFDYDTAQCVYWITGTTMSLCIQDLENSNHYSYSNMGSINSQSECTAACDWSCGNFENEIQSPPALDNYYCMISDMNEQNGITDPLFFASTPFCNPTNGASPWNDSTQTCECYCTACNADTIYYDFAAEATIGCHPDVTANSSGEDICPSGTCTSVSPYTLSDGTVIGNSANIMGPSMEEDPENGFCSKELVISLGYGSGGTWDPTCGPGGTGAGWDCVGHPDAEDAQSCLFCSKHLWGSEGSYTCVDGFNPRNNPHPQTGAQILADTKKANNLNEVGYTNLDIEKLLQTGCAGCPDPWASNYTGACIRDAEGKAIAGFDGGGKSCDYGIDDWEYPQQHSQELGCTTELCYYETGCSNESADNGPPNTGSTFGGICNSAEDGGVADGSGGWEYCKAPMGCPNLGFGGQNEMCCEFDYTCGCVNDDACNYNPDCASDPTCCPYGDDCGFIDCTDYECDIAVAYCPDSDGDGLKDPDSPVICYVCEGYSQVEITGDGVTADQCVNDNSISITPCDSQIDPYPDCPDGTDVDECGVCGGSNTFGTEPGNHCDDSVWADNNDLPTNYGNNNCGALIDDCFICGGVMSRNDSQEWFSAEHGYIQTQYISVFENTTTNELYCNCNDGNTVDCSYNFWNVTENGDQMYNGACGGNAITGCDETCCEGGNLTEVQCAPVDECSVCEGGGIPDGDCDCNGNVLDQCGVCGGSGETFSLCLDCDGDGKCQENSLLTECGNMLTRLDELNDELGGQCTTDIYEGGWVIVVNGQQYESQEDDLCPWVVTEYDCAGTCYDGTGNPPHSEDCHGTCGSHDSPVNVTDICGVCCDPLGNGNGVECSDPAAALTAGIGQGSGALDQCLVCHPDSPFGNPSTGIEPFQPDTYWFLFGSPIEMTYGSFGCTSRDWFGAIPGTNQHPEDFYGNNRCAAPEQGVEWDNNGNPTAFERPCGCMCAGCTNVHSPLWVNYAIYSSTCTDSEYNDGTCQDWNYNRNLNTDYCNQDDKWQNCSFAPTIYSGFNEETDGEFLTDWGNGGDGWAWMNSQESCYEGHGEMYFHYCNNMTTGNSNCCLGGEWVDGICEGGANPGIEYLPSCRQNHGDSCCGVGNTSHCRVGERSDLYWEVIRGNGALDYDFSWEYYVQCTVLGNCPDEEEGAIPGDANLDGIVNVIDIVNVVNHILQLDTLTEDGFAAADIDNNGIINVLDIVQLVHIILSGGTNGRGVNLTKREEALIMRTLAPMFGGDFRKKMRLIYSSSKNRITNVDNHNHTMRISNRDPNENTRDSNYTITGLDFLITAPRCIADGNTAPTTNPDDSSKLIKMGEQFIGWLDPIVQYADSDGAIRVFSGEAFANAVDVNVSDVAYHLMSIYWPEVKFLGSKNNTFLNGGNIITADYNDVDAECGDQTLPDCAYPNVTSCCVPLYRQSGNFGYGVKKPWKNNTMNNYCFLDNESIFANGGIGCPDNNPLCGCSDSFFTWTGKPAMVEPGTDGSQVVHSFGNYGVCESI